MAELRLNGEMNLLSTRYRVSSDCACRFKRQKWMVEVLRETSSDIGRIGLTGHERELLRTPRTAVGGDETGCAPETDLGGQGRRAAGAPGALRAGSHAAPASP